MKCENLQFNLSIYPDDCLNEGERALVDAHLETCPMCRQKLADFQEIRKSLRVLARPEMPDYVLSSVRSAVSSELNTISPMFLFPASRNWLRSYLMPYSVGVVASMFLGFMILGFLLRGTSVNEQNTEIASLTPKNKSTVMLTTPPSDLTGDSVFESSNYAINAEDFANARISVSSQSPSVNPAGALVALTKSLVRGEMKDEEVVVVADVFGNGLARIGEVLEQPRDAQTLYNLKMALENDPDYAPFVPASMDKRADSVQIVLKIQRVDVDVRRIKSKNKK